VTLFELLTRAAGLGPDRPFITCPESGGLDDPHDRFVTYGAALRDVSHVAEQLSALGIGAGNRIAAVLPSGCDLAYLWFAVAALGAVLVPLDPRLTDAELHRLLEHADPALAILPEDRPALAGAGRPRTILPAVPDARTSAAAAAPAVRMPGSAPLAVLYTSGSTGTPKGCLLTHDSFVVPAAAFGARLHLSADDVVLHVLPLHHMAGLSLLASAVSCGAHVILRPRFSGSRFWRDVERHRVTVFRHLGEMLAVVCAHPDASLERARTLRVVYGGGASARLAGEFGRRFGVAVVEGYGLSETNTVLCNTLGAQVPGTLGTPLPHVRIRLVDTAGATVTGASAGELWIRRNAAMMREYFRAPAANERMAGGWFRTGDIVCRDARGTLTFVGRKDEMIRRRGENIDPAEIENVLRSCPGVSSAAVVGVRDALGATELAAFLEPVPGATIEARDVLDACARRLAPFKHPRAIHILDRLPRTATEKINRGRLRVLANGAIDAVAG
jgi:acyl-CoA synthetase (AMP-forming)/AMP-acid ligase II